MKKTLLLSAVLLGATALHAPLQAMEASATTALNMRAGPGPNFPVVDVIPENQNVTVLGCIEGSAWCDVTFGTTRGWAYSEYLTGAEVSQSVARMQTPTVTYSTDTYWQENYADRPFYAERERYVADPGSTGSVAGAAGGAITGALIGGPIGAAVGGAAGLVLGDALDPPAEVRTYVTQQQPAPVYLDGEVVLGAGVPQNVTLQTIPDYEYRYAYINGQPVLVEPQSRRIVYIYR